MHAVTRLQQTNEAVMKKQRFVYSTREEVIRAASEFLIEEITRTEYTEAIGTPTQVKQILKLKCSMLEHEVFGVIFLSAQNHVITIEDMFRGTITRCSVYAREIAKACLLHNAAAVIFYHNHPSGVATPSDSDIKLTEQLESALSTLDIRVLDHILVAKDSIKSFAEHGLM